MKLSRKTLFVATACAAAVAAVCGHSVMDLLPHSVVDTLATALGAGGLGALPAVMGSYFFPEGSQQQFSQTFAAAKNITALTNANPAVATSVAHGYTTGDEILLTSGWEDATNTVFQITVLTADSFSINGLDSTNTNFFAAGTGTGTAQKITAWTAIPQVLTINASGGDARFTDVAPLAKRNALKIPTGFNATAITLTLAHDASNAAYKTMLEISRNLSQVAFKQVISGGSVVYGFGYMSVSEMPKMNVNQVNQVDCAITVLGRSISY